MLKPSMILNLQTNLMMITESDFESFPANSVFAGGYTRDIFADPYDEDNATTMRWCAFKNNESWSLYIGSLNTHVDQLPSYGEKITSPDIAMEIVGCDESFVELLK